ncbi:Hypothetical protein PBC10988_35320 [Planctomycetales bacterium 10988]|nr:Hypothetical protein PBC10988_35320 [Planctomycetales bacterium 10988]
MSTSIKDSCEFGPIPSPPPACRGKWIWRCLIFSSLLLVGGYFAPTLFATFGGVNWVLKTYPPFAKATLQVESAQLGWWQPIVLRGLTLQQDDREAMLHVAQIQSEKHLLDFLLAQDLQLGNWTASKWLAQVEVKEKEKNSDWEDVFLTWWNTPIEGPLPLWQIAVKAEDGKVELHEPKFKKHFSISVPTVQLDADFAKRSELGWKIEFAWDQHQIGAAPANQPNNLIQGKLQLEGPEGMYALRGASLNYKLEGCPLDLVAMFARRSEPDLELAGEANGAGTLEVTAEKNSTDLEFRGEWRLARILCRSDRFAEEQIAIDDLRLQLAAALDADLWKLDRALLTCDWGTASLQGEGDFPSYNEVDGTALPENLKLKAAGELALVELFATFPQTLGLLPEVELTSGKLSGEFEHLRTAGKGKSQISISSSEIIAQQQGKQIAWPEPIELDLALNHPSTQQTEIETLFCESEFLSLATTPQENGRQLTGKIDLQRLTTRLQDFIDLQGWKVAGQGELAAHWTWPNAQTIESKGSVDFAKLTIQKPGQPPHHETGVKWAFQTTAALPSVWDGDFLSPLTVEGVWTELRLSGDLLAAQSNSSWKLFDGGQQGLTGTQWKLYFGGTAPRWKQRANYFGGDSLQLATQQVAVNGALSCNVDLKCEPNAWKIEPLQVKLDEAVFGIAPDTIAEQELHLKGNLSFASDFSQIKGEKVLLEGRHFQANLEQLLVDHSSAGNPSIELTGKASGNLATWQQWVGAANIPAENQVAGNTELSFHWKDDTETMFGNLHATIDNFRYGTTNPPLWQEKQLQTQVTLVKEDSSPQWVIQTSQLQGDDWKVDATGDVNPQEQEIPFHLKGKLSYDHQQLGKRWQPYVENQVAMFGKREDAFQITIPFATVHQIETWQGECHNGWQRAEILGFPCGAANWKLTLSDGWIRSTPIECSVSEGQLRLEPRVRLAPGPMELHHSQGKVLTNVRVTPEMVQRFLQYPAPAIAGATEADGRFSVDLIGGKIPFDQPIMSEVYGRLQLHQMRIGSNSPMVRQIATLLNREPQTEIRRESVIDFQYIHGWTHHQNLELNFGDLQIKTQGSVGVDSTLRMQAEIPIPEKWLGKEMAYQLFQDQRVNLPVEGTLNEPRFNQQALLAESQRILRETARRAAKDQLQEGIDSLFRLIK